MVTYAAHSPEFSNKSAHMLMTSTDTDARHKETANIFINSLTSFQESSRHNRRGSGRRKLYALRLRTLKVHRNVTFVFFAPFSERLDWFDRV